ncbi:hypothetical protein VRK_26330 [Vibrio sp. MEBiC08052]|nr:hypothetical protein VRK_26330 [Vibrio sp. MEBiC08052]
MWLLPFLLVFILKTGQLTTVYVVELASLKEQTREILNYRKQNR